MLLRFSRDNRHLAVASVHGLRLCRLDALQDCDRLAMEAQSDKTALEFSADGRWLAVDMTGKVQVFGTDDTRAAVFETPRSGGLALLRFSPDGRWLAIGASNQNEVKLWDFQGNKQMLSVAPGGAATALAVSSDSSRVAASGDDGVTRVWAVPGGELQALISHPGPMAFVADGDRLVTAGDGNTLHLWESTARGETVRLATSDPAAYRFSEGSPTSVVAAVMAASESSGFSRWVEGAGNVERAMRQGLRSIVLSSDGRRAWAGHGDFVTAWDLQSLQPSTSAEHRPTLDWTTLLPTLKQSRCSLRDTPCQEQVDRLVSEGSVEVEAVSPNGEFAATGRADGVARIWRAGTAEPMLRLPGAIVLSLTNEHGLVSFPALDRWGKPDPRAAQQLRIYSLGDGSQQAEIKVDDGLWRAEFDPDGHRLLLVTGDYSIRVLEMPSARELWKRPGGGTPNLSAFSGDARLLAFTESIKNEGQVVVVESATGNPVGKAVTWSAGAAALAVSRDGRTVAVAGFGGQLGTYDVASGEEVARLSHADRVVDLAFSHDQQMLATASNDGTARIVDLRLTREIARIRPSGPPGQVRFSPGDRYLATAGANAMQLWTWRTEDQVAEACRRLPQALPPDEWLLYLAGLEPQACRPAASR
ncbi:WD40 repeat domain-containing protein [Variovorax sp. GT1P44]|uniref:WD40 repeat domain-containing protein n=1 Tax=Variovorax sp. GT1P44 TaxID=3443742 RepID=UPI003F453E92